MKTVKESFLSRVNKTPTCHLWTGKIEEKGYGRFFYRYRQHYAHRMSYELFSGSIPKGKLVLHKCDVRNCVNPEHLYLGNEKDNARDAVTRNRWAWGERSGQHKLKEWDVLIIFQLLKDGVPKRHIAKRFGVSARTIGRIETGETWGHFAQEHKELHKGVGSEGFDD